MVGAAGIMDEANTTVVEGSAKDAAPQTTGSSAKQKLQGAHPNTTAAASFAVAMFICLLPSPSPIFLPVLIFHSILLR
jgi:hypothetical protein